MSSKQIEFDKYTKADALDKIFAAWSAKAAVETVSIDDAVGRIAAEDISSAVNQPVVRAAQMDGYAVKSADFGPDGTTFPDTSLWIKGQDYDRADTGDDFDDKFDAVIAVENVTENEQGHLVFADHTVVKPGKDIRPSGAAIAKDELLKPKGVIIRSLDISTLAMGGLTEVKVQSQPKLGFIPTGSELIPTGQELKRGQIIDSNSLLAKHYFPELGAQVQLYPIVKDDIEQLKITLDKAIAENDIIIVNGGSSKGSEDFNTRLLAASGQLLFHGVAAAPGRPLSATVVNSKLVLNIPGPEMALFYVSEWLLKPVIAKYLGTPVPQRQVVTATLTVDFPAGGPGSPKPGTKPQVDPNSSKVVMETLKRVVLVKGKNGYEATPISFQSAKNGLARVPGNSTGQIIGPPLVGAVKGSTVEVEVLMPLEFL